MLKGWFPLHNKHWRNNHKCGEIEMEIQWRYVPGYDTDWEPPKMGAMSQIKMNSAETNLRMGDLMKVNGFSYHNGYIIMVMMMIYIDVYYDGLLTAETNLRMGGGAHEGERKKHQRKNVSV